MLKPSDYRETYVVSQDLPFSAVQPRMMECRQGLLHIGRVVSLRTGCIKTDTDLQVSAYVEGLGLVRLDSRWLKRMR